MTAHAEALLQIVCSCSRCTAVRVHGMTADGGMSRCAGPAGQGPLCALLLSHKLQLRQKLSQACMTRHASLTLLWGAAALWQGTPGGLAEAKALHSCMCSLAPPLKQP